MKKEEKDESVKEESVKEEKVKKEERVTKTGSNSLFPCYSLSSVYTLDFAKLYEKGYRAAFFDIDNTLVLHDEPARKETEELFLKLKEIGFKTAILSNNGKERVERFAKSVGADFYQENAGKPSPKSYITAARFFHLEKEQCLFLGDQLFTDILGGNRAGIPTVLVRAMGKEKYFHIVLKRLLEKPFLLFYKRRHALWKNEP